MVIGLRKACNTCGHHPPEYIKVKFLGGVSYFLSLESYAATPKEGVGQGLIYLPSEKKKNH